MMAKGPKAVRVWCLEYVSQLGTLTLGSYSALSSPICKMGAHLGDVLGSNTQLWV